MGNCEALFQVALTATCTHVIYARVTECLSLKDAITISPSPQLKNVAFYTRPLISVKNFASEVAKDIRKARKSYSKNIIFCTRYHTCSMPYLGLRIYWVKISLTLGDTLIFTNTEWWICTLRPLSNT